jgi:hypothetical protein
VADHFEQKILPVLPNFHYSQSSAQRIRVLDSFSSPLVLLELELEIEPANS